MLRFAKQAEHKIATKPTRPNGCLPWQKNTEIAACVVKHPYLSWQRACTSKEIFMKTIGIIVVFERTERS